MLLRRLLQIWSLFWKDRPLYWANLYTDATVNAGGKVNPVPVITLNVFAWTFVNASHRTGIDAIGNAFADISNNRVRHSVLLRFFGQTC